MSYTPSATDPAPPPLPPAEAGGAGEARPGAVVALVAAGAMAVMLASVRSQVFDLERYLVPKALALHLTALLLLLLGRFSPARTLRDAPGRLLAAFVAWSALSAALATNRWLGLRAWGISFSFLVVFTACRSLPARWRWPLLGWLLAAPVLAAVLGVAQAYGLDVPWVSGSRPPGGTFGNRNFLAHVAAIAAPALLVATLRGRRLGGRAAASVGLVVVTGAVVLTRSRAAWLGGTAGMALTSGLLLLPWLRPDNPRAVVRRAVAAALVLATSVGAAVLLPNALEWRTDAPYAATLGRLAEFREGSGKGRLVQYRNSLELVPRRPVLGVGPGNWFVHYPRVTAPGDPAWAGGTIPTNPWPSSDWVTLLTERGAVGTLLFLLAGVAAALATLREARRRGGDAAWAAAALIGVLAAAAVAGLFDVVLTLAAPSFLVAAAMGLLLPRLPDPGAPPGPSAARVRRVGALVAAALVAVAGLETAAVALTRDQDTATLETAARLAPWEHRLHLILAERGRCDHASPALHLLPYHPSARSVAKRCGS